MSRIDANRRRWSFLHRHGLLLVGASPIAANLIASVFNVLYNGWQIDPLLTEGQRARFSDCWQVFNAVVYPLAVASWIAPLWGLRRTHRELLERRDVAPSALEQAQRTVVNLPWRILKVASVAWLICIPVFPLALWQVEGGLKGSVAWHFATSSLTAGMIAVTHSFFAVELVSQRALFPIFFRRGNPADVSGARPLSIRMRGTFWALSATVSPVISLMMLLAVPDANNASPWFGAIVGGVAICYSLVTAWMISKLVELPVQQLKQAAIRVTDGDLHTRVNLLYADEFGPLIERFNLMVEGLRERERVQETFGRHVGREAARQILRQGDGLVGSDQELSVMFVDIRNFTAHSSKHSPTEVVAALNIFFRDAVETIERHGGMVNKFLGDGFMALFGVGSARSGHAVRAVEAGRDLICCLSDARRELTDAGWPELGIGIGVHSGRAVVGSIGSPRRQEYTAIGDTVNVASRVESLTKQLQRPFLVTSATRDLLGGAFELESVPSQQVKGKERPIELWAVPEKKR